MLSFILTAKPAWMGCENRRRFCVVDMVRVWVKQEGLWKKGAGASRKVIRSHQSSQMALNRHLLEHIFHSLHSLLSSVFKCQKIIIFPFTTHCFRSVMKAMKRSGKKVQLDWGLRDFFETRGLMWDLIIWKIFEEQNRPRKSNPGNMIWLTLMGLFVYLWIYWLDSTIELAEWTEVCREFFYELEWQTDGCNCQVRNQILTPWDPLCSLEHV